MNKRGFTLIEVMIVLAILAALIAVGAPKLIKKDGNMKSVTRHMTVLAKEIRNHARLFNATYRLAIRIEEGQEAYWVEKSSGPLLIDPEKIEEEMKNKGKKPEDDAPPPAFQIDKKLLKTEKTLPGNLHFAQVETINTSQPVVNGIAYIHFFPDGLMEASAIQITDRKKVTWTLVFNPLTGQADIVEKAVNLKDLSR